MSYAREMGNDCNRLIALYVHESARTGEVFRFRDEKIPETLGGSVPVDMYLTFATHLEYRSRYISKCWNCSMQGTAVPGITKWTFHAVAQLEGR